MADLYMQVYMFPEQLSRAREKVFHLKKRVEIADSAERHAIKASLDRAKHRLLSLEAEARHYKFYDLLEGEYRACEQPV